MTLKEKWEPALDSAEETHGIDWWENWFFNSTGFWGGGGGGGRRRNQWIIWVRNINISVTGRKRDRKNPWWNINGWRRGTVISLRVAENIQSKQKSCIIYSWEYVSIELFYQSVKYPKPLNSFHTFSNLIKASALHNSLSDS